jgi:hypothetical protein
VSEVSIAAGVGFTWLASERLLYTLTLNRYRRYNCQTYHKAFTGG